MFRKNSLKRHGEGCSVGVLPLALTPLQQAQGRSCSVRKTGLNGIARGGIFEAVSSLEKGVERVADPRRLDDLSRTRNLESCWQPSALFSIGRDRQNSPN